MSLCSSVPLFYRFLVILQSEIMELSPKQQIIDLVKKAKKILLFSHINPDGDAIGSILAFHLALQKLGKEVTSVLPSEMPKVFAFLPGSENLTTSFSGIKDFVITLDSSQADVDKLGYKYLKDQQKLNIVITPKSGNFSPENVSFSYGAAKYDLIFVLDSPDLERLSTLYDNNSDLFYETPIVNIDHHTGNDYFGKVNWVDLTATSTAEILVALLEALGQGKSLLDEQIATCLLAGIITDTGSFQNTNTTPKSLTVAAQLVAAGAHQQEIVKRIYKTKSLSTLKLWGIILSRLSSEPERFVWSIVEEDDFSTIGASEEETAGVVDELLKNAPGIDFALLISEKQGSVRGNLRAAKPNVDVAKIAAIFEGGGHTQASGFQIPNTKLAQVQEEIIAKIKTHQQNLYNNPINNNSKIENHNLTMPEVKN